MPSARNDSFSVTFWGTRGTLASPGPGFQKTGGNTICAQVNCGERILIFDAGTGIRELGSFLSESDKARRMDLLYTHVHYDHVEGTPFFAPFFSPEYTVDVWLGRVDGAETTEAAIKGLMRRPYFPVGPEVFTAKVTYRTVEAFQTLDLGDGIRIITSPLNHPGGATGYRVEFAGRSFAFVTDTEHVIGRPDENIIKLIGDCDLFCYDASFTDEEFPEFAGFGHSTWEEGLRLLKASGANSMLAMHHMPFRTDGEVDAIEADIRCVHAKSGVAREGQTILL